MADVTIAGASYTEVPSIVVPKTGGGTASFYDLSEDTVTEDSHIVAGYIGHLSDGTQVVGTGGGPIPMSNPIYSLDTTVFDGTSVIATDIHLENVDKDYTIFVDAVTTYNDAQTCLLHCMHETSPWNGMCIDFPKSSMRCIWKSASSENALKAIGLNKAERSFRLAISHTIGSGKYIVFCRNKANSWVIKSDVTNNFAAASENVVIGGYQTTNGSYGRYFIGTVNELKIFDTPADFSQCLAYVMEE